MQNTDSNLAVTLNRLLDACSTSQNKLNQAAQQARNRGLKLLLKSYAQTHADYCAELQQLIAPGSPAGGAAASTSGAAADSAAAAPAAAADGGLKQGWTSMRAWFTVRRQSRQRMLIREAQHSEQSAVAEYEQALRANLPANAQAVVERQLAGLRATEQRLGALAAPRTDEALLVRLYDSPDTANRIVDALVAAGIGQQGIYTADVERINVAADDTPNRERARWMTMAAAAIFGAVVGMIIVLPFAIGQRIYFPQLRGILTDSPNGVLLEYLLGGALVGAVFGLYFSIFIGQDIVEDDAYIYAESLDNGRTLVAVATNPTTRPTVERLLGLQHQFEVKPQAA